MDRTQIINVLENSTNDLSTILKRHLKELKPNVKDLIDSAQTQLLELKIELEQE